ncbi:hypothetical protein Tco_0869111 [Tanacetum coccineum]
MDNRFRYYNIGCDDNEGGFAICKVREEAARSLDDTSSDDEEEEENEDESEDDDSDEDLAVDDKIGLRNEVVLTFGKSWGRNSYVRALIEIRSDMEMKDSMVIAIPNLEEAPKKVVETNMDGFQNVKKRNASIKQEGIKMHIHFYILGTDVELEGMNTNKGGSQNKEIWIDQIESDEEDVERVYDPGQILTRGQALP